MRLRTLVLAFVLLIANKAFSCTCGGPFEAKTMRDVSQWYAERSGATLVFEGKVTKQEIKNGSIGGPSNAMSMTMSGRYRQVEFSVDRTYRGEHKDHISVITGLGTGDCGYDFRTDRAYLVYATSAANGELFTSICSGTSAVEDAGSALRFLKGEKPTAEDLLSPTEYWKQYSENVLPKRTGSICGRVLTPDGTPIKGARVEMWEPREGDFPSRTASDPNTSSDSGHFCIEHAEPGPYLLTVQREDFDNWTRYMAFYPGVYTHEEAVPLQIQAGSQLPDVSITTFREKLYRIRIHVVTPDGTSLSYKNGSGVLVDSVHRDPLSYHISHTLELDGSYTFGYIPAGKYVVATYFQPDFSSPQPKQFPEASKWKAEQKEVIVSGNTDVVITMEPAASQ